MADMAATVEALRRLLQESRAQQQEGAAQQGAAQQQQPDAEMAAFEELKRQLDEAKVGGRRLSSFCCFCSLVGM